MIEIPTFVLRHNPHGTAHWVRVGWVQALCGIFTKEDWPVMTPERAYADDVEICQECARELQRFGMKGHE